MNTTTPCKLLLAFLIPFCLFFISVSAEEFTECDDNCYIVKDPATTPMLLEVCEVSNNDICNVSLTEAQINFLQNNTYTNEAGFNFVGAYGEQIIIGRGIWADSCSNPTYYVSSACDSSTGSCGFLILQEDGTKKWTSTPTTAPDVWIQVSNLPWSGSLPQIAFSLDEYNSCSASSSLTIEEILTNGDESDIATTNEAISVNEELKTVVDEYDVIEQQYISDFNTNLDNINVSDFSWESGFLPSAMWVTSQFNELVMETPIETLITFSLIIGITLYLIGRYSGT